MDISGRDGRRWLRSGAAVSYSGLSRKQLAALARVGKITGIKPVRNWLFDADSIDTYLDELHRIAGERTAS